MFQRIILVDIYTDEWYGIESIDIDWSDHKMIWKYNLLPFTFFTFENRENIDELNYMNE